MQQTSLSASCAAFCGSLALHLVEHGVRYLVVMSRSGCADKQSHAVVKG
jgi:hypothetical protein